MRFVHRVVSLKRRSNWAISFVFPFVKVLSARKAVGMAAVPYFAHRRKLKLSVVEFTKPNFDFYGVRLAARRPIRNLTKAEFTTATVIVAFHFGLSFPLGVLDGIILPQLGSMVNGENENIYSYVKSSVVAMGKIFQMKRIFLQKVVDKQCGSCYSCEKKTKITVDIFARFCNNQRRFVRLPRWRR